MSDSITEADRVAEVVKLAEREVARLIDETQPSTAAVWERLARRAWLEGRLSGLQWAQRTVEQ